MTALNPRPKAVARCLLSGMDYPAIARELGIRPNTVRLYGRSLLKATGQDSILAATLWIMRDAKAMRQVFGR